MFIFFLTLIITLGCCTLFLIIHLPPLLPLPLLLLLLLLLLPALLLLLLLLLLPPAPAVHQVAELIVVQL